MVFLADRPVVSGRVCEDARQDTTGDFECITEPGEGYIPLWLPV
jgi:hypothetical protein